MINILHSGIRTSMPIKDIGTFNGFYDPNKLLATTYLLSLVDGKIVSVDTDGTMKLADGATDTPFGMIVRGFTEFDLGSNTTAGDQGIDVMVGTAIVIIDQIAAVTIAEGDKLYVGTGANAGLITNVSPGANAVVLGIAISSASPTAKNLKMKLFQ